MSATMRQMLEAGVHFGHQTRFWNPKMAQYIFGARSKIHIVNLEKTLAKYNEAMSFVRKLASNKGNILFVSTQAPGARDHRRRSQPLRFGVCRPALAGRHVDQLQDHQAVDQATQGHGGDQRRWLASKKLGKKEALMMQRELAKLQKSIGGIKEMNTLPDALFVIDVGYHKDRHHRSQQAGHPGDRRGRYESLAGWRRLRHSG